MYLLKDYIEASKEGSIRSRDDIHFCIWFAHDRLDCFSHVRHHHILSYNSKNMEYNTHIIGQRITIYISQH